MNETFPKLVRAVLVITAYQIRTAAAFARYFLLCTAAALWYIRPSFKEYLPLLKKRYIPRSRVSSILNGLNREFAGRKNSSWKGSIRISYPGELFLLRDPRTRKLQSLVIKNAFRRYLGISVEKSDIALLKQFSSAAWILKSLLDAAGYETFRIDDEESLFCVRVVYPVFIRGLRIRYNYMLSSGARMGYGDEKPGFKFPEILPRKKSRFRAESFEGWFRTQLSLHRAETEASFFEGYLDLVSLAAGGKPGRSGTLKFLNYMEQKMFKED
ncbi:MAG: hypothetical protein ACLFSE_08455 [Spirochaetia bacterium]